MTSSVLTAAPDPAPSYVADPFRPSRRRTRMVMVGGVGIGGSNPIRVQSMTTTTTKDVAATTAQVIRLVEAGCEIVRITAPTPADARAIGEVRARLRAQGIDVPLVADIHFSPAAAMEAVQHVEKVRVNPGNFADSRKFAVREYTDAEYQAELERIAARFTPLVLACKERGVAMRIGTNHGSLSDRIMNRFGDSPLGMVESALEFVRICEANGFRDVVLSMKASNPTIMIAAYRLLVARMDAAGMDYPLHLGVTEAGNGDDARIKSATGIGSLLLDGLGDTIRVSLAEEPEAEIPVARRIIALCARPLADSSDVQNGRTAAGLAAQPTGVGVMPAIRPRSEAALGASRATTNGWVDPILSYTDQGVAPTTSGRQVEALPWNPFEYARRPSRPVHIGGLQVGDGAVIAVAGVVPREDGAALPVLNGGPRKARRPDALVLDLVDDADLEHARRLAWKGEGRAPRPLIARSARIALLEAARECVDGLCLVLDGAQLAAGQEPDTAALARLPRDAAQPLWLSIDVTSVDEAAHAAAIARGCALAAAMGEASLLLSVRARDPGALVGTVRTLVAQLAATGQGHPVLLEAPLGDDPMLAGAASLGSLLCDGIGDAVLAQSVPLTFDLLQGAGARLTRTDYVACPSCGRTLFDLQTTTDRIKARTSHLKGVKIAIMGCVVNGPGEMADADFGYMGGSPGHVNLYVGKECVERAVPEGEADDRLVALIKAHGRWVEPGDAEEE